VADAPVSVDAADTLAEQVFGFSLKPAQRTALAALVSGRDTLAVLPTGSGKSAIYQIAGLALGGLTVVVSPLIALQRDQARGLGARSWPDGRAVRVIALNSTLSGKDHTDALARLGAGDIDFLMLGPEQLTNPGTHQALLSSGRPISLVAVDEAHLVSEWGHDFRPEYLRVRETVAAVGRPPVVALTATASLPVQADITRQLGMTEPVVVVADFDRPNIRLSVRAAHVHVPEEQAVVDRTVEVVLANDTPTIVYATSHARCEDVAERLHRDAYRAAPYHAGLPAKRRAEVQDAFFRGHIDVIAATSAFGMGIDKPDVRTVVHAGPPASLDEYYQEIGRAGRDGRPAHAALVFDTRSLRIPRLFAARPKLAMPAVRSVVRALEALGRNDSMTVAELVAASHDSRGATERIVDDMEELGLITVNGGRISVAPVGLHDDATDAVVAESRRRASVLNSQVDVVRHYAETVNCRRAELLAYFGEELQPPCGNCDNDEILDRRRGQDGTIAASNGQAALAEATRATAAPTRATRTAATRATAASAEATGAAAHPVADGTASWALPAVGAAVQHRLWGHGTVMSADQHEIVVAFESVGYRHLTTAVLDTGLVSLV
jgi:ATP-dependent DNA helicase RecQ